MTAGTSTEGKRAHSSPAARQSLPALREPIRYFQTPGASPDQQLTWLKVTVATALISGFALSLRLWISSRLFPLSPVTDALPTVPFPLDRIWLGSLFVLLPAIIIMPRPRKLILLFLALAGLLSLWDQTRWQPWFYQYFFMLAAMGFLAWQKTDARDQRAALDVCRFVVVSTYFWGGLQKLNATFVKETWPDFAGPFLRFLPEVARKLPGPLILVIPLLEMSIAAGLITRKYKQLSVGLAIGTHVFVLIVLIASGENIVVWPWNVAMILFVVVLFWRDDTTGPRQILAVGNGFHALAWLLFGILPALSFFDLWDSYLSAALYSGNTDQAVIYLSPAVIDQLPAAIQPHIWRKSEPFFLDINRWSYAELNVPLYPEPRIYREVTERICAYAGNSPDIRLRIKEKPNPLTGVRKSEYFDCDHLTSARKDSRPKGISGAGNDQRDPGCFGWSAGSLTSFPSRELSYELPIQTALASNSQAVASH